MGDMDDTRYLRVFAEVIRGFRNEAGLSQTDLSEKCGIDRSYISEIEKGARNPSLGVLLKLAEGLSVPLSVLIIRTEILLMEGNGL